MRKSKQTIGIINAELLKVSKRKKTLKKAAKSLGTSQKSIGKWYEEYKKHKSVILRTNIPHNKFIDDYNQNIISLYEKRLKLLEERFTDPKSLAKALPTLNYFKTFYKISASTEHIRKVLINAGYASFRTQRKTKSGIRKAKKKELAKTKDPIVAAQICNQLTVLDNIGVYNGKTGVAGFRIEADGDFYEWFGGNTKNCLLVGVDTFTGTLLNLWISKEETNIGYLGLLKGIFNNYGIPEEGRTDKRNGLCHGKVYDAWSKLGTNITSSSNPVFKPNVERMNETLQGILPNLFLDWGINSIDDFINRKEEVINFINSYLKRSIPEDNIFHEPDKKLMVHFYLKDKRKVVNRISHVSLNGNNMAPFYNGKRISLKDEVTIYQQSDGKYFSFWNKKKCFYKVIKDILKSPEEDALDKQKIFDRKKAHSYEKTLEKKEYKIENKTTKVNEAICILNQKIDILKTHGIDIPKLKIIL